MGAPYFAMNISRSVSMAGGLPTVALSKFICRVISKTRPSPPLRQEKEIWS
ncbi:hypothetical protein [Methylobacterium frigidaeris]|uniref:hypothetical protein n=1 Tax=Methylobacterium frigidaeris TaxID=2038277 RepID=UPI001EDEEEC7|nr:hypothetical protein [Methylobacterium frigidaeris]